MGVASKGVRKLKSAAFNKLEDAKMRTQTQLNELVTVDLIQYASESMDGACDLATKAKSQVIKTKEDTRELVESKINRTKQFVETKVAETQSKAIEMIEPHKVAIEKRLETVYTFTEGKW